eukprot:gb/GECG01013894.1/.p1 GENE.gb/GECG01013894.1/~~gb/GECG01013894.1/.p1  ORF type:complete len:169 (+),score=18.78 gb/GECG01013894.1/:1-507(+)
MVHGRSGRWLGCCCCGFSEREYDELLEYLEDDSDSEGDIEGVRQILKPYPKGFCNSIKYLNERTPLLVAATVGNTGAARVLVLEFGASVRAKDFNGCLALHKAAENGKLETVKALVEELGSEKDINAETPFRQNTAPFGSSSWAYRGCPTPCRIRCCYSYQRQPEKDC